MAKRIAIIGGGAFGLYISWFLAGRGHDVTVFEREKEVMTHASYHNQARVHNGYHYPRSVLTALRSRISMPRFVADFGECVFKDFKKVYCVGRPLGKVTGQQFYTFCRRIGAEIEPAGRATASLMNPEHVEACFIAREYAFDALKLRDILLGRIEAERGGAEVREAHSPRRWLRRKGLLRRIAGDEAPRRAEEKHKGVRCQGDRGKAAPLHPRGPQAFEEYPAAWQAPEAIVRGGAGWEPVGLFPEEDRDFSSYAGSLRKSLSGKSRFREYPADFAAGPSISGPGLSAGSRAFRARP